MDYTEFKKKCIEQGFFKESGHRNTVLGEEVKVSGTDINRLTGFTIDNPNLGFNIRVVLQAEDAGEYIYISGTENKDGIYYFDVEAGLLVTVEDLESDSFLDEFGDADEYESLSADERVDFFEKQEQISHICDSYEDLFNLMKKVK